MASNIYGFDTLRQRLGYGARPNKYLVTIVTPSESGISLDAEEIVAFCKGSSIPNRDMGIAEIWMQGRKIPVPGDAQFSNSWDLTFYNDQTHNLRAKFEKWIEMLDSYANHKREFTGTGYYADNFMISQLDAQNQKEPNANWVFFHVFPTAISQVDFGADANDQISEFTVTFTYAYFQRVEI